MPERAEPDTALIRLLPEQAVKVVIELLRYSQHIPDVAQRSATLSPAATITGFSSRIAKELHLDSAIVVTIATALWQIKNIQQGSGLDAAAFVGVLGRALEFRTGSKWADYRQEWEQAVSALSAALDAIHDDHPLLISAKATLLAYSQQNLFLGAHVITDVRPVFNAAGDKIVETVITHTLLVRYRADNQPRLMTFALDQDDVVALRKQCERAERKSLVAADSLRSLNAIVLPEGNLREG